MIHCRWLPIERTDFESNPINENDKFRKSHFDYKKHDMYWQTSPLIPRLANSNIILETIFKIKSNAVSWIMRGDVHNDSVDHHCLQRLVVVSVIQDGLVNRTVDSGLKIKMN